MIVQPFRDPIGFISGHFTVIRLQPGTYSVEIALPGFSAATRNVVVALAYDTARAAMQGIANAAIPTPRHVRDGLERIRWMPATNGGPSCYVQFGPGDHKGYKGDFLTFRELRDGELRFDGYFRPQWPVNQMKLPPTES